MKIKKQSSEGTSVDVEDVWFGSGGAINGIKSESNVTNGVQAREFYAVKGLINLGNTCFFNAVLQNLLAMDRLQEYLLKLDGFIGPLTNALKKLFVETNPDTRVGNVVNPKSLFECVCAKAPQFRGYQQQDSHELLRCLLDGMSTEELSLKGLDYSLENGRSPLVSVTFVDAIFGGQLSSTICCVECGNSSVVYEPFLDLSLPVPTKKPPSKKAHRNRKTKMPTKRVGRTHPKESMEGDSVPLDASNSSTSNESSHKLLGPCELSSEKNGDQVGGSSSVDPVPPGNMVDADGPMPQSYDVSTAEHATQIAVSSDDFTWLDFLEPVSVLNDINPTCPCTLVDGGGTMLHNYDVSTAENATKKAVSLDDSTRLDYLVPTNVSDNIQYAEIKGNCQNNTALQDTATSSSMVHMHDGYPDFKSSSGNSWEDELPLQVQESDVLLLPYKEENVTDEEMTKDAVSSSLAFGGGENLLDFDGFGALFDEPEDAAGPRMKPLSGRDDFQATEDLENGFLAGNISESDQDEVDNTDSTVSIESCLAHFTKPELLSDEHAWHCDNCLKILLQKRGKSLKNKLKVTSIIPTDVQNDESSVSELNDVPNPTNLREEEENGVLKDAYSDTSGASCCIETSDQTSLNAGAVDSCRVFANYVANQGSEKVSESARECESGECEKEEMDSKNLKVMRDATKRILISRTPHTLTIHLKRFSQDARGRLSKLSGHISFKEMIDLGPFMNPRRIERGDYIYQLIGVVEHSGTMRGGHYVAYVRGGDRSRGKPTWYHASDTYVRVTSLEDVLRSEAYILFYEKT
ncbi:hypothetical protein Nepgr_022131 [Nepenthes gracilis]|uniref:Ubiquitin carboxyl-terminal hydrolase n=1 Tax=Nepenthes gracilis TaxID=150966 RepID=A0AAD3T017_NEPGR|nr:hypothetical protein Nepgr_022131 [Nepenthes gracilis]